MNTNTIYNKNTPVNVQAVFFNVDGTLIDPVTKKVSQSTKNAINILQAKGIKVLPVTFHSMAKMDDPALEGISWDGYVLNGGALLCDKNRKPVYEKQISPVVLKQFVKRARKLGVPLYCAGKQSYITSFNEEAGRFLDQYQAYPVRIEEFNADQNQAITALLSDPEVAKALTRGLPGLELKEAGLCNYDLYPKSVSKAKGVAMMMENLGLDPAACVCFGDSISDLPMIEQAAIGAAMSWSDFNLLAKSDVVCSDNRSTAIFDSLKELGLLSFC